MTSFISTLNVWYEIMSNRASIHITVEPYLILHGCSYTRIVKCLARHTFIPFEKMTRNSKIIGFVWLLS